MPSIAHVGIVKHEVAEILRVHFSFLEKENDKQLRQQRAGRDRGEHDKSEGMFVFVLRHAIERRRHGRTRVIRDEERQHHRLKDESWKRIRARCFPSKR